jgi:hypothetical protein
LSRYDYVKRKTSYDNWFQWIRKNVQKANPLLWAVDNSLACAPRPLRYHPTFGGRGPIIPQEARPVLDEWLKSVKNQGIGTIVVLATCNEMKRYASVVTPLADLLALYRSCGFLVHHHPVEDPHHAVGSAKAELLDQVEALKQVVLAEYGKRTGGMLIHCSGGMDRSAPIAAYVANETIGDCPFSCFAHAESSIFGLLPLPA